MNGTAIEELPSSIGCLSRLLELRLFYCNRLKSLPSSLCKLKSLQYLYLIGCSNLQSLPGELANFEASNNLYAEGTRTIDRGDKRMGLLLPVPLSLDGLHITDLTCLYLTDCSIPELPKSLGGLSSIERLYLEKNNFERIQESIIQLSKLKFLYLSNCQRLQSLPKLPCKLQWLDAHHCTALESLSSGLIFSSYESLCQHSNLSNNFKLDRNEVRRNLEDALQEIQLMATAHWKQVCL